MTMQIHDERALWRRDSTGETARDAAEAIAPKVPNLRLAVLRHLEVAPATPEGVLQAIRGEGRVTLLTSIRPRCSELCRMGLITDSGSREPGEGGGAAIVWRVTTAEERAAFDANSKVAA